MIKFIKIVIIFILKTAPVAQWIERLFPKQKVEGSTPSWRASYSMSFKFLFVFSLPFLLSISFLEQLCPFYLVFNILPSALLSFLRFDQEPPMDNSCGVAHSTSYYISTRISLPSYSMAMCSREPFEMRSMDFLPHLFMLSKSPQNIDN